MQIKRPTIMLLIGGLILVMILAFVSHKNHQQSSGRITEALSQLPQNNKQYSISDPSSIWIVVNKRRPLKPLNYAPNDLIAPAVSLRLSAQDPEMFLRKPAAVALTAMFTKAAQEGVSMRLSSGYRSYDQQINLFNYYVNQQGREAAEAQSARPGYSEHQTGLAADVAPIDGSCDIQQCFAATTAGVWLASNAYKYGFIIRYSEGLKATTGYEYEPWHVRYVGDYLAAKMHARGVPTLEQYFGLSAAPTY